MEKGRCHVLQDFSFVDLIIINDESIALVGVSCYRRANKINIEAKTFEAETCSVQPTVNQVPGFSSKANGR